MGIFNLFKSKKIKENNKAINPEKSVDLNDIKKQREEPEQTNL